ncbi:MAG: TlpA disulfide reductase family protein [Actinomycetia bacterium]|nr:TlpA disulfide reductase family protein [Actinomycetes bacterium]
MGRRTKLGLQLAVVATIGLVVLLLGWRLVGIDRGRHIPSDIAQGKRPATPDFVLPRLDQEGMLQLSSLRGTTVILNFWASWCAPCRDEASVLQAAWKRYEAENVVVLGINTEDLSGDARDFIERFGLTYPNVRDVDGRTPIDFGLSAVPETYVVNAQGRLVHHVLGPVEEDDVAAGLELAAHSSSASPKAAGP